MAGFICTGQWCPNDPIEIKKTENKNLTLEKKKRQKKRRLKEGDHLSF